MFTCCVSILTSIGDRCDAEHCVKNQGNICFTFTCFMCYMHDIFWSLDVLWCTWHLCHGCQFYQWFIGAHICFNGSFDVHNTTNATMANQVLKVWLNSFGLLNKSFLMSRTKRLSLNTLTLALTNVVIYFPLQLTSPFVLQSWIFS